MGATIFAMSITAETFYLKPHMSRLQNVVNLFGFISECDKGNPASFTTKYESNWYEKGHMQRTAELNQRVVDWVDRTQKERGFTSFTFNLSNNLSPALIRHGYDGMVVYGGNYDPTLCWYFPIYVANNMSEEQFGAAYAITAQTLYASLLNRSLLKKASWNQHNVSYPPIVAHNWRHGETFYYDGQTGNGFVVETPMKMHIAVNAITTAFYTAQRSYL